MVMTEPETQEDLVRAAVKARQEGHYYTALNAFRRALRAPPAPDESACYLPDELVNIEHICHEQYGKSLKRITPEEAEAFVKLLRGADRAHARSIRQEHRERVCKPICLRAAAEHLFRLHQAREEHDVQPEAVQKMQWRMQTTMYVAEAIHMRKYCLPLFAEKPVALRNGPAYLGAAGILARLCPDQGGTLEPSGEMIPRNPDESLRAPMMSSTAMPVPSTEELPETQAVTAAQAPVASLPCLTPLTISIATSAPSAVDSHQTVHSVQSHRTVPSHRAARTCFRRMRCAFWTRQTRPCGQSQSMR
eukprot:m.122870 g.122870  ORF g.122870 m.122870 type:complete len:305 (+) comp9316_c0_seq1:1162-2076(+)